MEKYNPLSTSDLLLQDYNDNIIVCYTRDEVKNIIKNKRDDFGDKNSESDNNNMKRWLRMRKIPFSFPKDAEIEIDKYKEIYALFSKCLGPQLFFHDIASNETVFTYISSSETNQKFSDNKFEKSDDILAYIEFNLDKNEDEIYINYITTENLRKTIKTKGLGALLLYIAFFIAKKEKITNIKFDDMSDNARQPNNIYLKFGIKYEEPKSNSPEMIGEVKKAVTKGKKLIKTYFGPCLD